MMVYILFPAVALIGYLIGSLNYSIMFSRVFMNTDIRSKGSGNAGSTNMLRNYGWRVGVITLATDFLKTYAATITAWALFGHFLPDSDLARTAVAVAGLFCALGHCYPVYFGFKGGKGVAVGGLTVLMVDFRCFLVVAGTFLICVALFRYVSLGSVLGATSFPVSLAFIVDFSKPQDIVTFVIATLLALLVICLHNKNIVRLFKGTETKISFKK